MKLVILRWLPTLSPSQEHWIFDCSAHNAGSTRADASASLTLRQAQGRLSRAGMLIDGSVQAGWGDLGVRWKAGRSARKR
jgi:hypothetical protein